MSILCCSIPKEHCGLELELSALEPLSRLQHVEPFELQKSVALDPLRPVAL